MSLGPELLEYAYLSCCWCSAHEVLSMLVLCCGLKLVLSLGFIERENYCLVLPSGIACLATGSCRVSIQRMLRALHCTGIHGCCQGQGDGKGTCAWNDVAHALATQICSLWIMAVVGCHTGLRLQSCLTHPNMGPCRAVGAASASGTVSLVLTLLGAHKHAAANLPQALSWSSHGSPEGPSGLLTLDCSNPAHPGCRLSGTRSCSSSRRGKAASMSWRPLSCCTCTR